MIVRGRLVSKLTAAARYLLSPLSRIIENDSSRASMKKLASLPRYIHHSFFSTTTRSIQNTFHKRPLPASLIALSSAQGKLIFKQALNLGGLEGYFPLSEQFITQSEPSFCSISSLAMVLNALNHDPKKVSIGNRNFALSNFL
jgi:hypothetical protein